MSASSSAPTRPAPPRSGSGPGLTLPGTIVLGALAAFGPLSIDMYLPALPRLAGDLGAPQAAVQLTVSGCLVGLGLGQLVAGPVSDAFGRRRPLLLGVALYAVASWAAGLVPSLAPLIAVRFLQGLAGAAGLAIGRAVVRDLVQGAALARIFSLLMLVTGVAPIAAPVLGAQILRFASWRAVFAVLGAIGVLVALGVVLWLPESLPADRRRSGGLREAAGVFRDVATSRAFLGCALSFALAMSVLFSYISASPFVLQGQYRLSAQAFSLVFGANALCIVAASQLNGALAGRVPAGRLLTAGLCLCVGAAALLLTGALAGRGLVAYLVPLAMVIGSLGLIAPNATALALTPHPRSAGAASAQLGAMQFAIGAVLAPLTGLRLGTPAVSMAAVVAGLAAAALLTFTALRPRGPG